VLNRSSGNATDRLRTAHGLCSFGKTNPARGRLRRAQTLIRRFILWTAGPPGQAISPALRDALSSEAVALDDAIGALEFEVVCPIDA
jgi:hypothetical protein